MKQPLDHLRSRKKPVSKRIPMPMDSDLADAYNQAKVKLVVAQEEAKRAPAGQDKDRRLLRAVEEAEAEVERTKAELEPELAWFIVRSIGPKRYDELQSDHPPSEADVKEAKDKGETPPPWDADTFPRALIVACVQYITRDGDTEVFTPLTPEFVDEMFDDEAGQWNQAEMMGLFQGALEVNSTRRTVDMGNGSGRNRNSGKS